METTTWGEIKLATLQKMFSSNGQTIKADSSTMEYINSMPQVANEALELLSTAGKFLIGQYTYSNYPIKPAVGKMETVNVSNDDVSYRAHALAYYFTIQGKATLYITVGDTELDPIEIDAKNQTVYKDIIDNPDDAEVTLTFHVPYQAHIRNVALYDVPFASADEVEIFEEYIHIHMDEVLDDFYQIAPNEIYLESGTDYIVANDYFQEAFKTLVIPRDKEGTYTIYYRRYPGKITFDTVDDYVLPVDPEVAAIIPLYMASELYKDDDASLSTIYRNEFEVARENLSQSADIQKREFFTSDSGWV